MYLDREANTNDGIAYISSTWSFQGLPESGWWTEPPETAWRLCR